MGVIVWVLPNPLSRRARPVVEAIKEMELVLECVDAHSIIREHTTLYGKNGEHGKK